MKVVLFCGGQGTRLRDYSEAVPKPMVQIGHRPILWHVMKYYAYFGHTEFILCLGYKSEVIKRYFLDYDEAVSNDFVLSDGGREVQLLNRDIQDWRITFVQTGVTSTIGERLLAVRNHLEGEEVFLANYTDGLSDLWLPDYLEQFHAEDRVAAFVAVKSPQSFHVVDIADGGVVTNIDELSHSAIWINGGYFAFRSEIFDHLRPGEDLVLEPFRRLIDRKQLFAYRYDGFWRAMDTFKDKQALDDLYETGEAPWELWKRLSSPDLPSPPAHQPGR